MSPVRARCAKRLCDRNLRVCGDPRTRGRATDAQEGDASRRSVAAAERRCAVVQPLARGVDSAQSAQRGGRSEAITIRFAGGVKASEGIPERFRNASQPNMPCAAMRPKGVCCGWWLAQACEPERYC